MKGRSPKKSDKDRYDKMYEMGCCVCKKYLNVWSPASPHHIDGRKKPGAHQLTIPLCGAHHQTGGYGVALHFNKTKFISNFGSEMELLEYTNENI
jgi:Recombination enhancement, RecA-dependent nuclease